MFISQQYDFDWNDEMTIDIDALKQDKRPQSSTIVHALIDRLEAAESEALEEARLNGMGSEREAALMAKLEAAEKERDALRAKIAEMEKQEPVATIHINSITGNPSVF